MPGHFAACPANAACVGICSTPFSHGHGIVQFSPSLCTVHFSFPGIRSALYPAPSFLIPDPPHFPFPLLLSSFGDTTAARLPRRVDPSPSPLLYFPLRRSRRKHAMFPTLSPYHAPSVYPIPAASASGVLLPSPFSSIKSPWTLLFFFIPFPHIRSRAMKSNRHCEARFVSLR